MNTLNFIRARVYTGTCFIGAFISYWRHKKPQGILMQHEWTKESWRQYPCPQVPDYADPEHLSRVTRTLSLLPGLVYPDEIECLKKSVAKAGRGEAFLLQGGDCAESFEVDKEVTQGKLHLLSEMANILSEYLKKPIIRIGRIAGQYAKPRSENYETQNGITLPSYRGDLINRRYFSDEARKPDPDLLLKGYQCASNTMDYIRLAFDNLTQTGFYTSHEALHLPYEEALTRLHLDRWYNLSTHFPWIGMRTALPESAHIEMMRGIENPIGIKIGPSMTGDALVKMLEILNQKATAGKILLIARLGRKHISEKLPRLIEAVKNSDIPVTWSCDPMHGNTEITPNGFKTRHFDNILFELAQSLLIHESMDNLLGGIHFELTGENVTECVGGASGLTYMDLNKAWSSPVDPRLNYDQALEMVELFAGMVSCREETV